jgi:hypothetical protein
MVAALPRQDWQLTPPEGLEDRLRLLDGFSISTRYPDSDPEGTPGEHLLAVGVFGSYGRGDAGVGSDLDLVLVLRECAEPIWDRLRRWDTGSLPLRRPDRPAGGDPGSPACRHGPRPGRAGRHR